MKTCPIQALFILAIAIITLIIPTDSKLTVKSRTDRTAGKFDEINGLDYVVLTPQNKITFKRTFRGNAVLASPEDACSSINSFGTQGDDAVINPVLVATWGECHYAQKVSNAENAGAKMLILVLKHQMPLNHPSVRELPLTTNIEVLAVSEEDGTKLVEFLRPKDDKFVPAIDLVYSYEPEKQINYKDSDKEVVDFWFVAADISKQSYMFLTDLREILLNLKDRVTFQPHYVLWQNEGSMSNPFSAPRDFRCIAGGLYCDPEPETDYQIYGAEGVIENLRQLCFWKREEHKESFDNTWWRFVLMFGTECVDLQRSEIEQCRRNVYQKMKLPDSVLKEVDDCMKSSFAGFKGDDIDDTTAENRNEMLDQELVAKDDFYIDHYPALYVNKQRYLDSFRNRYLIQDFVCSHFTRDTMPQICLGQNVGAYNTQKHDYAVYGSIIVVSIVFMVVVLYCIRRGVKKQVMGRMNDEISHIVVQYKQFKDKSNSFSNLDDA